ncbi:molybdopterin-dependent oxidoreductase [Paracoccus sp. Ld10]|uniref:molybdopterin-dependent oxidoreductase n=1 Tax=Paracoccus sp. Ld10 TaxID=649158 RepID=UPI00386C39D2
MKTTALFLLLALGGAAQAGDPLLTVDGPDGTRNYDQAALSALGLVSFTTSTIWTERQTAFTGVPLQAVLTDAGIDAGVVSAVAINEYAVQIPVTTVTADYPIVALQMDGKAMSVRDKGPLWLVYPYDSDPALQSELILARSIWQMVRIESLR